MALGVIESKPKSWLQYWIQDCQETPGRLTNSLRLALTSVLVLIVMMVLRIPFAAYGMYVILVAGHDTPPISLRVGIGSLLATFLSLSVALMVVILTDNNPMARILALVAMTFIAGMISVATTLPALGSIFGFIFGVGIGFWENHVPADTLVKNSLWLLAAFGAGIGGAVAVGYLFSSGSPADKLAEQLRLRYRALAQLFEAYASDSTAERRRAAAEYVSRMAAAGQTEMLELYNQVVNGNFARGSLPIGTHVQITLVTELLDSSAGFGFQADSRDAALRSRCQIIAQQCGHLARALKADPEFELRPRNSEAVTHLDRVEAILQSLQTLHSNSDDTGGGLVKLPSKRLQLLIPGSISKPENIAFALKISLCATICYIVYHAIDWPGISTSVTTVMVTGLVDTGAMKQKLLFRMLGTVLGGLVLGLGAEIFLFPFMDSITSLILVIGGVAFLCAWMGAGARFNYVGLQVAFAFYLTSLEGFGAPRELEPARDRFVGILLAMLVMWFVFDQIWPVRTITALRRVVAAVLKDAARVVALTDTKLPAADYKRESDTLRDRLGKQLSAARMLNEATEYEFGVGREKHMRAGDILMQISMTTLALIWNQAALLHRNDEANFLRGAAFVRLRQAVAQRLSSLGDALAEKGRFNASDLAGLETADNGSEYSRNTIARYNELRRLARSLQSTDG